jgi:hypothetical protein
MKRFVVWLFKVLGKEVNKAHSDAVRSISEASERCYCDVCNESDIASDDSYIGKGLIVTEGEIIAIDDKGYDPYDHRI